MKWIAFFELALLMHRYGMNPVFGTTNSFWLRCPRPRILSQLLSALPNSNYVSVMYGSQFSYPEMRLSVVDISSLSAALSLTMSSDGMNTIVSYLRIVQILMISRE